MKLLFENWREYLKEIAVAPPDIATRNRAPYKEHGDEEIGLVKEEKDIDVIAKVVVFNEENKVLVLRRGETAEKYANYWDLPGGHLQEGEDLEQGATRETKEEVGLDIKNLKKVGKYKKRIHFFTTKNYSGTPLEDMPEHSEKRWVSSEELAELEFPPGGKEAIYAAIEQNNKPIQEVERYQKKIKANHCKLKDLNINSGGNNKKEGPGVENASCERSKSAPPGAGGV